MSSTLPQLRYFDNNYRLPHSPEWSLSGHSRALERTGFILSGPATVLLDAGIDVPDSVCPDMILITHTHIDHSNAVPMLMRHYRPGRLTHIFAPAKVVNRLREFAQLSYSMKVDYDQVVPDNYCMPCKISSDDGAPVYESWEESKRRWRPVRGGLKVPVGLGKSAKQIFAISTVALFHKRCSTIGYVFSERKSKLMPHLEGSDKKGTAANVMAAKSRGEAVTMEIDIPILAFICDTSIDALSTGPDANIILSVPLLMIECTYLEPSMEFEAASRAHICWSQLCPIVKQKFEELARSSFSLVLFHFSLRYSDNDIISYFLNSELSNMGDVILRRRNGTVVQSDGILRTDECSDSLHEKCDWGPCHIVLWLDSGIEELWFKNYCSKFTLEHDIIHSFS